MKSLAREYLIRGSLISLLYTMVIIHKFDSMVLYSLRYVYDKAYKQS